MRARKLARQVAAEGIVPQVNESWDEWLKKLDTDLTEQGLRVRTSEEIPSAFEEDDDEVLILEEDETNFNDRYVGETQQGEAVYHNESGDRYEER
jgi:hypothetical protein